jgi:poly(3-hydroxybutyrate) depolymerase
VVFAFHGGNSSGAALERYTGLSGKSDKENFIAVYPNAHRGFWNDGRVSGATNPWGGVKPDDVKFVASVLSYLATNLGVVADKQRIYATGISNGAILLHLLGQQLSKDFAAIASVAGNMPADIYNAFETQTPQLSVLTINGDKDPIVPLQGGAVHGVIDGKVVSLSNTLDYWLRHNFFESAYHLNPIVAMPNQADDGCKAFEFSWNYNVRAKGESLVKAIVVAGGGHTWPGTQPYASELLIGKTCLDFNATEKIWDFFKTHPKQRSENPVDSLPGADVRIPLIDMKPGETYKGQDGGLYGNYQNVAPAKHLEAAMKQASMIEPLDDSGRPSPTGKVALISIGMSNTAMEYQTFKRLAETDLDMASQIVVVNGGLGGKTALEWATQEKPWDNLKERLARERMTSLQVQAAWIKLTNRHTGVWPDYAMQIKSDIQQTLQRLKRECPNIRIVYLSSRIYAGYAKGNLNPEPGAYEGAFSMRWLIQDQVQGSLELNYDPTHGDVKSPLLLWGPYLWADGMKPRPDGLIWEETDFLSDGTHPSRSGEDKVARILLSFFKTNPTTVGWFLKKR